MDLMDSDVYLYILMRTDLASMNSGKGMAQATHAANQMVYEIQAGNDGVAKAYLDEWQKQTGDGFGTCIVLGAKIAEIEETVGCAVNDGAIGGIVHDPTYPLRDGEVVHLIPLDTCGYLFGRKDDLSPYLSDLSLHP